VAHGAGGAADGVTSVASGAAAIQEQIRDAIAGGYALRVCGGERWLDAGRPVDVYRKLSTRDLTGIVSYVPGDLTLTARAGTTLAELRDATAANKQWLALDPYGDDAGTIGATVVTASAGPLASSFGTPRDLVLGVEFVSGLGAVVRGGGRVVKNVAGFDLTRLMIGSWGTLGVVTEVTVRLHARPETDITIAIPIDDAEVAAVRALLRRLPFTPYACELLNDTLASRLLGGASSVVVFRLGGNTEAVAAQRRALAELGTSADVDPSFWTRLRADDRDAIVVRWSTLPARIAEPWNRLSQVRGVELHASPVRGIVRAMSPNAAENGAALISPPAGITVIGERLPASLWTRLPAKNDRLQSRTKAAFDPSNVLNPGILGVSP
jgi:glycolate oxidase FAD binding subunit